MNSTDIPDDAYAGDESPPDLGELDSPDSLLTGGSTRERLLDIVTGLRTPTKVSDIADLADCDTETARDYLEWFDQMGRVHRHDGRPVRYERNDAYFHWQRIDSIRDEYTDEEIVGALSGSLEQIEEYRAQFNAGDPDGVSLVEASQDIATKEASRALSEWETLKRRAALFSAARRDHPVSGRTPGYIDA